MFEYRNAKHGDEKDILELIDTVLSKYGLHLEPDGADFDVADIKKFYSDNDGWFQVLEKNNKIVGSVGIYKVTADTCELRKMYLYEEFHGQGIGKQLLNNALIAAKTLGYSTITLQTNSLLTKALPLYKNFGFEYDKSGEVCSRCDISMIRKI